MSLENKVAIVTGSSRGIGAATARLLASHGAKVAVNYSQSQQKGEEVLEEIRRAGGQAILVQADVTDRQQVDNLVTRVEAELGPVDILINNASMTFPVMPFAKFPWEDFEKKIVNEMKAAFFSCQRVVPGMLDRKHGCIVNVSSGLSRSPGSGFIAHSSAKSALDAFSKSLALELGPSGIRVNVVAPGLTRTDATAHQPKEMHDAIAVRTPLRKLGEPEDVAGAILYLCTDEASHVSGVYLPVSGGAQMI